ncbi:hypothetical protein AK812_SmicGene30108 [Symbiodinium microadriaticum]|uniref:HYR domain-containing protein n=1 Tax=Symbiodinium microadriaticum TaxID=2951 RepID=A0A1Q9D060_SYMMI|nr:hypothetical protein AK812_SmicGene30108 [Symbiodinium microadriaticum]
MSYFVGHKAVENGYLEDAGFAINGGKGWSDVVFQNHQIDVSGDVAIAMGTYFFTSAADGSKAKVEYTFGYKTNADGKLRICLHHSSVPFADGKPKVQPAVMARAVELYKNLPMGEVGWCCWTPPGSEKRAPRSAGAMAIPDAPLPTIALTGGPSSGASVPVGSAGVTFTATDAAGNTAIRSFSVQVNDNDPPTLEVEDVDVNSCTPTVVTFSPAAADNCPGATAACSPSSGSEFPVGETEVTCTAVDAAGKTTQESFVVLVKCDGHGYYKKSHGNNIRKRRNPHMKKWLHYWDQYRR